MNSKNTTLLLVLLLILSFSTLSAQKKNDDYVKFGGAVRYNLYYTSYESDANANDGQFTFDTWRLNVKARQKGVDLDFEYRFYPTFDTHFIHHGFLGYSFSENLYGKLGVTQVPFGNLKYASHSWWFVTPYYVGLEDDYDMGLNLTYKYKDFTLDLAYFIQPEPAGPAPGDVSYGVGGSGRYSYDVIPTGNQSNQEKNQFNIRAAYNFVHSDNANSELGFSGQYGQIYNSVLDEMSDSYAFAAHLNSTFGKFNLKTEYIYYSYDVTDDMGNELDVVQMGAYGSGTYDVAAKASMFVAGLSYDVPVDFGPISNLTFYDDYTITMKDEESFEDTHQNILGFLVTAGSIYTYCDVAMGKNQPWLTDNFGQGLGAGVPDADWNIRYNINIGYYF